MATQESRTNVSQASKKAIDRSKPAVVTDEVKGSAAFRQLGHELNELCSLLCDGDRLPGPSDFTEMAAAVAVSLNRNFTNASEEHRQGFTRDMAELISLSFDGCGVDDGWWGEGASPDETKVHGAPVKPQATPPSATSIDLALKIIHEHHEQMLALSTVLEQRLASKCEREKDDYPPLTDWRLAQVLNDMLSSTKVLNDVACLLRREMPGQEP